MNDRVDRETTIKGLRTLSDVISKSKDFWCEPTVEAIHNAIHLLKEQEPKTPIHIHEEYPEHDWETDEDGNIDEFAMDYGFHNGPACKRCGYSFCEHCKPNGWNDEPCVIDYYQCPKCGKMMFKGSENIVYCGKCGQAVKWE